MRKVKKRAINFLTNATFKRDVKAKIAALNMREADIDIVLMNLPCYRLESVFHEKRGVISPVNQRIAGTSTNNGWAEWVGTDADGDGKFIAGFKTGLKKSTFVHEGLHCMGLYHSFDDPTNSDAKNKFQFRQGKTINIMDYAGDRDNRVHLFKWQWEALISRHG